jgi:dihydrofolate synthase/folylpolyglutamate synthase
MPSPSLNERYKKTLDYLFHQLPMYQRVGPKAFKKDLRNIQAFCALLGHPEKQFPSIHIAGTNGKGSTAHILSAVLQAHGFKTGLYTSPHYRDFRERIKINGKLIPKQAVIDFVEKFRNQTEEIRPSFFEWGVALAFHHFAEQKVDIAVIETGLGGRLDSTNVIHPLISLITNISYDHMNFLGDTLAKIAFEKAGIIKPGVPVVIGEWNEETRPVFEQVAAERSSPLFYAPDLIEVKPTREGIDSTVFKVYRDGKRLFDELPVQLRGAYQAKNLQCSLAGLILLAEKAGWFEIQEEKLRAGLENLRDRTRFIGRWQLLSENPRVLCDSAHNLGGVEMAMAQLKEIPFENLHIVLGIINDKDMRKVLSLFPTDARYYFARPDIPRGMDASQLQELAGTLGLQGRKYSSVRNALRAARRAAGPEDLVYVGGSTFVVAEVV